MVSKIGAHVETIFHIGSCALATSTLTSIAVVLYVPPSWLDSWHGIHGFVYTADGTQDESSRCRKVIYILCCMGLCHEFKCSCVNQLINNSRIRSTVRVRALIESRH
jgi:hypothetical protein